MSLQAGNRLGPKKDWGLRQRIVEAVSQRGVVTYSEMRLICSTNRMLRELVSYGLLKTVLLSALKGNHNHQHTVHAQDLFGEKYACHKVYYCSSLKLQLFLFDNLYEITNDDPSLRLRKALTHFIHGLGYPVMIDTSWTPRKKPKPKGSC